MHFTVLVTGNTPDADLEPYQENNMGDCPREYMEFIDASQEQFYIDAYRNTPLSEYEDRTPRQVFTTIEDYLEKYEGFERDEETDKVGYWYNPQSKWDWYVLGGRWTGYFSLKDNLSVREVEDAVLGGHYSLKAEQIEEIVKKGKADSVPKKFIDWEKMKEERKDGRFPSTYAVLHEGEWMEQGWVKDDTEGKEADKWDEMFQELIKNLPDDTLLSVYDCHV